MALHNPNDPENEAIWSPFQHIADSRKRAFLEAYVRCLGVVRRACREVGINQSTPYTRQWKEDEEFQEAFRFAESLAPVWTQDAARERAILGLRRYQFDKEGRPLRHPNECECGHDRREWHPEVERGDGMYHGPCAHQGCDCRQFEGAPYYEHEYSDRLLQTLLKGESPEKYGDKLQVSALVAKVDMSRMPDVVVDRVADGEDLQSVLASVIAEGGEEADQVRAALPPAKGVGVRHRIGLEPGELVQEEEPPTEGAGGSEGDDAGLGPEL